MKNVHNRTICSISELVTCPPKFVCTMMVFLSVVLFSSARAKDLVKILPPTNPFDKGPKVWFNYLKSFLFHEFKGSGKYLFGDKSSLHEGWRSSSVKQSVQVILFDLYSHILSAENISSFYQKAIQRFCLCKVCKADRCLKDKFLLITEPVGSIILKKYLENIHPHFLSSFEDYKLKFKDFYTRVAHQLTSLFNAQDSLKRKPKLYKFAWSMKLDKRLSTKFAFTLINIKHGFQGTCSEFHRFVVISGDKSQGGSKFVFCGLHTPFSLFPLGYVIKLLLICHQPSDFSPHNDGSNMCWTTNEVDAQFTLVDHKMVISQSVNVPVAAVQLKEKMALVQMYFVVSFVVCVSKRFNILFKLLPNLNCTHNIFNGPGSLHDSLKLNENEYTTKTFQAFLCLVCQQNYVFNHLHNETFLINEIHYKAIAIPTAKSFLTIRKQMTPFNISSFDAHAGTIVEHLVVAQNFKAKITLKTRNFTGYHSPKCCFGGIAFLDNVELLTSCENISYGKTFGHDILSSNHELYLVVFWYKVLGKITVHFNVENTMCNKVHLDPCSLQMFCSPGSNKQHLCNLSLARVSSSLGKFKYGSGSFVDHMIAMPSLDTLISFTSHSNISCFIIQVWSKDTIIFNKRTDCFFTLQDDNQSILTSDIEHHIKVLIPPDTYETGYVYYPIRLIDADKIVTNNRQECEFNIFMTRGTKCYFTTTRYAGKPQFFAIEIGMPPHYSSSWIDIRITFNKRTNKKEIFPIGTQKIVVKNYIIQLKSQLVHSVENQTETSHMMFFLSASSKHKHSSDFFSVFLEGIGWRSTEATPKHPAFHFLCFCTTIEEVNEASLFFPFKYIDIKPPVPNLILYIRSIKLQTLFGRYIVSKKCDTLHPHIHSFFCKNISIVSVRGAIEIKFFVQVFTKNPKISWQHASNICEEFDGYLPQLHDTAALEELIHLVKSSAPYCPVEGLFLGLMKHAKVCCSSLNAVQKHMFLHIASFFSQTGDILLKFFVVNRNFEFRQKQVFILRQKGVFSFFL